MHSRTIHKSKIGLSALLVACSSGRLVVGNDNGAPGSGGTNVGSLTGGSPNGGSSGAFTSAGFTSAGTGQGGSLPEIGNGGRGGASSGGSAPAASGGRRDDVEQGGAAGLPGEGGASAGEGPTPPRWLSISMLHSTASLQTAATVVNLNDPNSGLIMLASNEGGECPFSPDGRFACFVRQTSNTEATLFLADATTSTLGAPRAIADLAFGAICTWSLDGRPDPDPAVGSAGVSGGQSRFEGSDRQGRGRLVDALMLQFIRARSSPAWKRTTVPELAAWFAEATES